MPHVEPEPRKVRLELLDGTVEVTGTEEFVRKAQSLFIKLTSDAREPHPLPPSLPAYAPTPPPVVGGSAVSDIRTLKEQKQPRTQLEMAALVAYYVAELAGEGERSDTIGATEITRYFGQAGYRTTSPPRNVLSNAKAAGYLDNPTSGQYKLNPVGYNLVTAGLPATGDTTRRSPSRKKVRNAKKKVSARKSPARKKTSVDKSPARKKTSADKSLARKKSSTRKTGPERAVEQE